MQDWKLVLESLHLKGQGFEGTPERVALMWKEFLDIELISEVIKTFNPKESRFFLIPLAEGSNGIKTHL